MRGYFLHVFMKFSAGLIHNRCTRRIDIFMDMHSALRKQENQGILRCNVFYRGGYWVNEEALYKFLPEKIGKLMPKISETSTITEIRLRALKPVLIFSGNEEYALSLNGGLTKNIESGVIAAKEDIKNTLERISGYSLYAWEDELKNGFITLPGGHRAGICGKVVIEAERIKTINHISSINIRVAHKIKGCSDRVFNALTRNGLGHTLIISPPSCGKTTMLRDLIRNISNGKSGRFDGLSVGVVDERQEIAGSFMGIAQNDVGFRTDVLDRCPKAKGMIMLLRGMSPRIIAVDEIGSAEDIKAIGEIINAGVKLICTVHGRDIEDIRKQRNLAELLERRVFDNYIVMSAKNGQGTIEGLYDSNFQAVDMNDI